MEANKEIERVKNLSEKKYDKEVIKRTYEKTLKIAKDDKNYDKVEGWCYLGKIEWTNSAYALTNTSNEWGSDYLWTKIVYYPFPDNEKYFAVGHPFYGEVYQVPFDLSIIQFLRMLISYDRLYGRNGPIQNLVSHNVKIKLRGMTEWLEPDLEWYEGGEGGIKEILNTNNNDSKP